MSASGLVSRREACRLCNKSDLELAFSLKPTPPGDAYLKPDFADKITESFPLDLFLCNSCGLLQMLDVVDPKILYGDYIYFTSNSLGLIEHFDQYAQDAIQRVKPYPNELVVDIGSNDGTLLRSFKNRGMKTLGIEPASRAAEKSTEFGIHTIQEFFNSKLAEIIKKEMGGASIITANNVFANLDNLEDIIDGVKTLMLPNGVFIFETGYMVDMINNNVFDNIYHEHLSYFSVKPLTSFFDKNGMELIHIKHLPTKGGSIRGTVQPKGGVRKVSDSVRYYLDIEDKNNMDKITTYKSFYSRINKEKDRIHEVISKIRVKGLDIAGYGASVGVTTMIYEWELGNLLSFIVDDNPNRHYLVSPGFKIPILPSEEIYKKQPGGVVILSWRYSEPIINKNKKYLDGGGRFITPFSELSLNKTY